MKKVKKNVKEQKEIKTKHNVFATIKDSVTGITIITLAVTIIVLLILAGVTIATLTGDNGILTQATRAKKEVEVAEEKEKIELSVIESVSSSNEINMDDLKKELNRFVGDRNYKLTGKETYIVTINKTGNTYRIVNDTVERIDNYEEGTMYVTLYKDGTLVFSATNSILNGKEVEKEFGNLSGSSQRPWIDNSEYKTMIKKVIFLDEVKPISTQNWFAGCENLEDIEHIGNLNAENVQTVGGMFSGCSKLKELDLSKMNAAKVKNMRWMFAGCTNLTHLNLSGIDTSNVTNMTQVFIRCENLVDLNIENFNTSNVTSMVGMFYGCSSLKSLDVSHFNTSQVTSMESMFQACSSLTSLDLSNFNTSQVTSMKAMFQACSSLTSLDLSNFNTSQVTSMKDMFYGSKSLTTLDLSNFNTNQVTDMYRMFSACKSLITLDLSMFNTSQVTSMSQMFYLDEKLKTIYVSEVWNNDKVTSGENLFIGCKSLKGAIDFDSSKVDVTYANYLDGYFTLKNN